MESRVEVLYVEAELTTIQAATLHRSPAVKSRAKEAQ